MAVKRNIVLCLVLVAGVNVYAMHCRARKWDHRQQNRFEQRHAEEEKQREECKALIKKRDDWRLGHSAMLENNILMYQEAERQAQEKEQKK